MKLWRILKLYYYKFKRLQGSPYALAGGTAIGVFIGLTPTIPFHTALIVVLSLATRTSAIAGIIISWIVCNPLTFIPIYYFSALLGNYLTPYDLNLQTFRGAIDQALAGGGMHQVLGVLLSSGYEALIIMGVGGFFLALPFGIVSYYLALRFFVGLHRKRISKKILS